MAIVLGRLDAYIVQRGRITEIVLRRVGVGMKHIWCGEYLRRLLGPPIKEVVKIGIDTK